MFFVSSPAFQKKQGNANITVSNRILNFFQFSQKASRFNKTSWSEWSLLSEHIRIICKRDIYLQSPLKNQVVLYILCNKTPQDFFKQTEKMLHEFRQKDARTGFG